MKQQSYFMRHSLWRKRNWKTILKVVLVLFLLSDGAWIYKHSITPHAHASAISPKAVTVYGQAGSFTTATSTELYQPRNSATDSSNNLYVADTSHHRVLYYPAGSTTATRVYGQNGVLTASLQNNTGGTANIVSATSLYHPSAVALDSSNNLYVTDTNNNRVLYYPSGTTTATRVYGQNGSFSTALVNNTAGTASVISATSLSNPIGIALDSSNNLYIVDNTNNRVLYFPSGTTTATRVYGQNSSFSTALANNTGGTVNTESATSLNQPRSPALDSSNNLYIVDNANYRVLYYPSGTTTATRVYGQNGSFSTALDNNTAGTASVISATSLSSLQGINLDNGNNLYVADTGNNRVLYYPSGTTTATRVYGQNGSFSTALVNNTGGTASTESATSLNQPYGINIDASGGNIYITDNTNNRILEFQTSLSITTQPPSNTVAGATFSIATSIIDVGSGGTFSDSSTISVTIKAGTGTAGATLSGNTSVSIINGVAAFSNLSINLTGTSYILTSSSSGMSSVDTTALTITTPSTPTGYWPLDEGSGTTTADLSGNNNTGTLTGASWTTGKLNGALSFNGTTNYVSMGTPATLKFGTGSFTVISWFKTTDTGGFNRMVGMGDYSWTTGYFTSVGPYPAGCTGCVGGGVGGGSTASSIVIYTTSSFNDGNWHQEAMTINQTANTAQIYVDGVAQAVNTQPSTCGTASGTTVNIAACTSLNATATTPFSVGSYYSGTTKAEYFNGNLDEIRVYNSALNSSLIQNQYAIDTTPSPTAYWPLDENSGLTAYDSSSNNSNGTLTGGPTWTNGVLNSALSFNGSTNYVSMGTPTTLKFGVGSFTIMNWFKTTATNFGRMVGTGMNGYSNGFDLGVNTTSTCSAGCVGAELGGGSKGASVSFGTTATTFNDGTWHQAAMVIDQTANTAQLYVDGIAQTLSVQAGTCGTVSGTSVNITSCISASATNSTDPFTLGAYHSGSTTNVPFTGSIDEVRVYNSALTGPQIFNRYNSDLTLSPEGYWHFDEDSGTTAYDSSSNNNNGTLSSTNVVWTAGKINSGLSFSAKYVNMGSSSTLRFNNTSFSLVSWFNSTSTAHSRFVGAGFNINTYSAGFELGLNTICTGCVGGALGANGTSANEVLFGTTTTTFNDGNWHQAVMVVDQTAKTVQIYVDGVAQPLSTQNCGTASGTIDNFSSCTLANTYTTTDSFSAGAYTGVGGIVKEAFTGSLDEVRVYGGALSDPQILSLYTNDLNTLSENAADASFSGNVGSTVTYTLPIALTYQLTPAPGWSILITSTTLTSGANTIPTTASTITAVTGTCTVNGTCSGNTLTNTISGFPLTLPAGTTAPAAVKFFGTAAGTGTGAYTVTPTISVKIPISTKLGTYSSVVTLAAAVGP